MATVDSLDIQISAQVNKANASLTTLINRLDRVSASLAGVNSRGLATMGAGINKLANAMSNFSANTKTADFSRLSRNLASISNIDTSKFSDISSKMSQLSSAFNSFGAVPESAQQIGEFARNISKLGNKGITNAITNIPQLAVAMRNLMQTLSTAPVVSQNVIQMTNALANLASQGGKVGTASRTMISGLNNTSNAMNRAKKSSLGLAAAFGKFYATWFLVIRGIKGFMKSVESTTDYIEAYNYYNVAFGKIASEWDKDFEKYGYQNAESYAESFTKRMNETLGKLSGVQVNLDTGLLEETGLQNLGLNIQEITQYASQLASVTNSIGQTGEVSLAAAKSMTMLAGDISSLFNIDFSDVAQNINSALIGQSRAVYRYGIDITNATLQTYAYNLGLEKSVSEMTQAEKMQLRMIAILDQSKVSWGDLANTINSPSNMLRQFKNNVKELGMVFGQLFIPVLQKVMPIINGVTIALKRLMVAFANILGIKIDFDAFGQGYSDLGDDIDDVSDSLDGVAKSAKKANAGLRAFDELKVINLPDTSIKGAGTGGDMIDLTQQIVDATSEYEKVWNEAFAKMENTAQEWADRIEKYLEPVKKIFKDFAVGDFFQAGKDTSALVSGIFNFFAKAIDKVDWYGIGQNVGNFIAGINWEKVLSSVGNLIWQGINAAVELWAGAFDAAPIETAIITGIAALGLPSITISLPVSIETLGIAGLLTGLGIVYEKNKDVQEGFKKSADSITKNMKPAFEFLANKIIPDVKNGFEELKKTLKPFENYLITGYTSAWKDFINPSLLYLGEVIIPMLSGSFQNFWNDALVPFGEFLNGIFGPAIEKISSLFNVLLQNILVPLGNMVGNVLKKAFEGIVDVYNNKVLPTAKMIIAVFQFLNQNIFAPIADFLWSTFKPAFESAFEGIGKTINNFSKHLGGLIDFVTGVFAGNWSKAWSGIKEMFFAIWSQLANLIKTPFNAIVGIFEGFANKIIDAWNWIKKSINSISVEVPSWLGGGTIGFNLAMSDHINIPKFAKGGITLTHTLAEIGEYNKPEAILPLTDTKSMGMIADTILENAKPEYMQGGYAQDYIKQIEEATYRGTMRAIRAAGGIKAEATFKVENDRDSIFKITQEESNKYFERTGKPAYNF